MWPPRPQPPAPLQEGPERGVRVWRDAALVLLGPHFQAGQHHLNVQSPENLREQGSRLKRSTALVPGLLHGSTRLFSPPFPLHISKSAPSQSPPEGLSPCRPNLIHIIGHLQKTLLDVVQVPVLSQKLERQRYGGGGRTG